MMIAMCIPWCAATWDVHRGHGAPGFEFDMYKVRLSLASSVGFEMFVVWWTLALRKSKQIEWIRTLQGHLFVSSEGMRRARGLRQWTRFRWNVVRR